MSHSVENSHSKKLRTCETDCRMKEVCRTWQDDLSDLFCPTPETRQKFTEISEE